MYVYIYTDQKRPEHDSTGNSRIGFLLKQKERSEREGGRGCVCTEKVGPRQQQQQ